MSKSTYLADVRAQAAYIEKTTALVARIQAALPEGFTLTYDRGFASLKFGATGLAVDLVKLAEELGV